jgi:hypothetical protein
VVCNFTPVLRNYRMGLPKLGVWREVLNTDSEFYGGSGAGNLGAITAEVKHWDEREYSAPVVVPGLSTVIFKWEKPVELAAAKPVPAKVAPEVKQPVKVVARPAPMEKKATPETKKSTSKKAVTPKKPVVAKATTSHAKKPKR